MWSGRRGSRTVTCVACGGRLERSAAREYDKHGDRWNREGKEFEYLCKPCFRGLSKGRRDGLEALLVEVDAGECEREEFLSRYVSALESHRRDDAERETD